MWIRFVENDVLPTVGTIAPAVVPYTAASGIQTSDLSDTRQESYHCA